MSDASSVPQSYLLGLLRSDLQCRGLLPGTVAEYCRQLRPLLEAVPDATLTGGEIMAWISERDTASKQRFRWLAVKALFRMLVDEERDQQADRAKPGAHESPHESRGASDRNRCR